MWLMVPSLPGKIWGVFKVRLAAVAAESYPVVGRRHIYVLVAMASQKDMIAHYNFDGAPPRFPGCEVNPGFDEMGLR
jgi:hypothetical protein